MKIVKMAQSGYTKIYALLVSLVASMFVLTETGGTVTTDGTVQILYVNDAPAGVYSPRIINIDFTNQTATETIELSVYYRIKSGGTPRLSDVVTVTGAQDVDLKTIELKDNRFGVLVTIEKTAGTNRAYDYEVFYKV